MKFTTIGLLIGAARSAVAGLAFVVSFSLAFSFAPAVLAQEEAAEPTEEAAPAEAVETIPVESTEAAPAAPAEAAPAAEGATELDAIEVTGSRIKRTDYETAQPILVIKREDIERTGMVSIGDILQNLPQAGAALSRAFNNGGNGATEIDLRNLGSSRVLVLVNGRRWVGGVSTFNTSGVDLNTIPISVIDSIEVLKDGASAVYGSDAIAGVVNIKTRRDFVGAEARGHIEATEKGDGVSQLYSFAGGTVAGKTSVFFNVDYVNQGELLSGSRKESAVPVYGIPTIRPKTSASPWGRHLFVPTNNNASAINAVAGSDTNPAAPCYDISTLVTGEAPPPAVGVLHLCDLTLDRETLPGSHDFIRHDFNPHAYNFAPINYLITPNERTSIFGQLSHQITDQIRFSSEVLYTIRKSSQQLAPMPYFCGNLAGALPFDTCHVADDNPYNPTNPSSPYYIPGTEAQDIGFTGDEDPELGLIGLGAAIRRFVELGPRIFSQNVDTMRIGGGFDGSFGGSAPDTGMPVLDRIFAPLLDRFYSWDGGYAFTESKLQDVNAGLIDGTRIARASGPIGDCVDTDTTSAPPDATGCVPMDWFGGPGTVTPEMINYFKYTAIDLTRQNQQLAYANVSTEVGELSRWLAGPLGVAFGLEYRKEFFASQPDPLKVNRTSSTNAEDPTRGEYAAKEAYLEFRVPVLADVTFDEVPGLARIGWLKGRSLVQDLEVSLASRYSYYTGFGDNVSGKVGLRYKPYEDLILRSTYSSAFRAPAITDLFLGQSVSFPEVDDPCAGRDAAERDDEPGIENIRANCDADGAADTQTQSQINTTFGGNPELGPETARTLSAGIVYSPEYLPDFNIYLDWYSIELVDFIDFVDPDDILDLCYRSDPSNRSYCDLVGRGSTGQLSSLNATSQNFSALNVEGVDFNIDWILPLPETFQKFGTFQWLLDAAYVTSYEEVIPTALGEQAVERVGTVISIFGGSIPRWKVNTGLNWRLNNWEATWNVRYIHHIWEECDDGAQDTGVPHPTPAEDVGGNPTQIPSLEEYGLCSGDVNPQFGKGNQMKETFYNDVQAGYSLPNWNTKLTFGVINALGQDPPRSSSAFADSYDKATYDPWGSRTPYLRAQVNF